jgi:hypothetical protein
MAGMRRAPVDGSWVNDRTTATTRPNAVYQLTGVRLRQQPMLPE